MDISPPRHFPFCLVWTSIPVITWIFPFVGHLGVCRADGTILDFFGPFNVEAGNFGFGNPKRYLRLDPRQCATSFDSGRGKPLEQWWDEELEHSAEFFRSLFYNFCGTNCHSFVAFFLNQIAFKGYSSWNTVLLAFIVFFKANHINIFAFLRIWTPFFVIMTFGFYCWQFLFLYGYLMSMGVLICYFLFYEYGLKAQARLVSLAGLGPSV